MIRTHVLPCALPPAEAGALNHESGRIYTRMLVEHYRVWRHTGHWLSPPAGQRLEDALGGPTRLHAHSRDAAQQGFYRACKTAAALRRAGHAVRYPHRRTAYRTTVWKNTGIRVRAGWMLLARARGLDRIAVELPAHLASLPADAVREVRLVWDAAGRRYAWHVVVEDGRVPAAPPGDGIAAVDLGEVHPAAATDGRQTVIFSARALRSCRQHTAKRLAALSRKQAAKQRGSRAWKRLQRRKSRFLAKQKRRTRDIEHKVSRAVVDWAVDAQVGTLVVGDVRDVADGKRLNAHSQQKLGLWSHGKLRAYLTYKCAAAGIRVELEDEAYSSQTCPTCGHRHKPSGRVYRCPNCGFCGARDAVGAVNILSRYVRGAVGQMALPAHTRYRRPFVCKPRRAKRSPTDGGHVAWAGWLPARQSQEAAPL